MSDIVDIIITDNTDTVDIHVSEGEINTMSNVGGEKEIYKQKTGNDFELRTLKEGSNVTITQNDNDLEISSASTGEANTASNLGVGEGLFTTKSGVNLPFKSLTDGTSITLTPSATEVEISVSDTIYGAGSGLTPSGGNINLGGSLTGNTTISNNNSFYFRIAISDGGDTFTEAVFDDTGFVCLANDEDSEYGTELISQVTVGVGAQSTLKSFSAAGDMSLDISTTSGLVVTDEINSKGLEGAENFSANATANTYIQKIYADSHLIGKGTTVIDALNAGSGPGAGQDGYNMTWSNSDSEYILTTSSAVSSIEDSATTTGLYTEEESDILVGHSANTGTSSIFKLYEGTGTPVNVFNLDGNGNIFNNGTYKLVNTTGNTTIIGTNSTHASLNFSTALGNVVAGNNAGNALTTADYNVMIGDSAGLSTTSGSRHILIGNNAGRSFLSYSDNVLIGHWAGYAKNNATSVSIGNYSGYSAGAGVVTLGYMSMRYSTDSNVLFIDNQNRGGAAAEKTDSIIYGIFDATATNQVLRFNANVKIAGSAARATTEGTNHLDIFDGTAPVGTLANGISLYSTAGELRVMDAAGNATLLSPHDKKTNEWIYDSVDIKGKRIKIYMERMMKAINKEYGWDLIEEFKV